MSTPTTPRLSIGLPVFNGERFLDDCIESICSQSFSDFELIVCDNASTDCTPAILESWRQRDPRVIVHVASVNRGAAANFNWSFQLSRGELFKWCACDDVLEREFLAACVARLDADPTAVLSYSGTLDIDPDGRSLGPIYDNNAPLRFADPDPCTRFLDLVSWSHSCITVFGVIRRWALERSSLIGPYVASDKVLLAELGVLGRFVRTEGDLLLHRQHEGRSVTEYPRLQERAQWFDTKSGRRYPHFRLAREYVRVALSDDLTPAQKRRCLTHVLRWIKWEGAQGMMDDVLYHAGLLK